MYVPFGTTLYHHNRYWRDLLGTQYGLTRDMWYSATNGTWNTDEMWFYVNMPFLKSDYGVDERFYFCSSVGNGNQFYNNIPPAIRPPANLRPLFPRRLGQKSYYNLVWGDLSRSYVGTHGATLDWGAPRRGANHLDGGKSSDMPAGTHLAHIDGSVEWVPGSEVKFRTHIDYKVDIWW